MGKWHGISDEPRRFGSARGAAQGARKLRELTALDDPESVVVPVLIDAIIIAESYRGARHEITFLPELTRSVDALIRELNAAEKAKEWAEPLTAA